MSGEITVFAATSLVDVFGELGSRFEQANPGTRVVFNFGGSQQIRTQIEQGARSDILATANRDQMQLAVASGVVANHSVVDFARNKLTVVVPVDSPNRITSVNDLARPGVKMVLAQPDVPAGQYSVEVLGRMSADPSFGSDFASRVRRNVVSEEPNVRLVLAKVQLGEADAGIVYTTDLSPGLASRVRQVSIPDQFNVIAEYPIAVVEGAHSASLGKAFVAFVLSPEGQACLRQFGFFSPD